MLLGQATRSWVRYCKFCTALSRFILSSFPFHITFPLVFSFLHCFLYLLDGSTTHAGSVFRKLMMTSMPKSRSHNKYQHIRRLVPHFTRLWFFIFWLRMENPAICLRLFSAFCTYNYSSMAWTSFEVLRKTRNIVGRMEIDKLLHFFLFAGSSFVNTSWFENF